EQHGRPRAGLPDDLAHLETVELGHHDVEDGDVGPFLVESGQRLDAVSRLAHLVAGLLQDDAYGRPEPLVVIRNKNHHAMPPPPTLPRRWAPARRSRTGFRNRPRSRLRSS